MPIVTDPGYGPNGERVDPSGLVSWQANPPPVHVAAMDDVWTIYPLGFTFVPYIDQDDDEVFEAVYLGGVVP